MNWWRTRNLSQIAMLAGSIALGAGLLPPLAEAAALKAEIYLVQAGLPKNVTERGLIDFARRNRMRLLREDQDADLKKRKWKAEMIITFNRPVDDLEFQVLFYDIHDGPRRFVDDMATFVNDRKQKTFVQKVTLPRSRFKPNRNMELVVTVKRQEVGRLKFGVVGEEEKRSGEVSFGDNER